MAHSDQTEKTDGSPLADLTAFQRDLLVVLDHLNGRPHGLAIKEYLEDNYGTEIQHGRLYPNLDSLVEKGLVGKGQRDQRTNEYWLTNRGKRELAADHRWRCGDDA